MTALTNRRAAGAPGYAWDAPGAVVEVPADLAAVLLAIPDGGFSEAPPKAPESRTAVTEPAPADTGGEARPKRRKPVEE